MNNYQKSKINKFIKTHLNEIIQSLKNEDYSSYSFKMNLKSDDMKKTQKYTFHLDISNSDEFCLGNWKIIFYPNTKDDSFSTDDFYDITDEIKNYLDVKLYDLLYQYLKDNEEDYAKILSNPSNTEQDNYEIMQSKKLSDPLTTEEEADDIIEQMLNREFYNIENSIY